ncbi:MAG: hypothetical protein ACD_18C00004G0012 [uncultured bacterium]|nr:MAG: hypothetical protein ACD_18C00004G0012 [uncultured bacterium]
MSDEILQHLITVLVIILLCLVYFAGYIAGSHGWYILFIGLLVLYPLIHKLLNV